MAQPIDPSEPTSAGPSRDMMERFAALKALDPAVAQTLAGPRPLAAAAPDAPDSARYTFDAVFAEGGLGRIRRAHDHRLQRTVAVKEMREHLASSASAARFQREALLTARLEHPAIVSVQDLGTHPDGAPYYCMKLVDGDSLHALVRARPALADRLALLPHVLAVADALAYAHDKRIIHRDLKPANVLVGAFGETVVIDWGLAKDQGAPDDASVDRRPAPLEGAAELTRTGEFLGTLPFMPAEQAESGRTDARADVYAIGAILYFVLANELPYGDQSSVEMLHALLSGPPPDLATRVPGLPEDLLAIVRKAMAYRADDRYPSAKELAADLHRFAAGRLVTARPYSPLGLLRHYARRYRSVLAVASVALLALAATTAYSYASVLRERDAATAATADAEAAQQLARHTADQALLAQARAALDTDLAAALTALRSVDLADESTARRVRLLALAAETRGAPAQVLRGHTRPIHDIVALADGGLVSVDAGGSVWRWDPAKATGREVFALGKHSVRLTAAATAPVWAAMTLDDAHVVRADGSVEVLDVDVVRKAGILDAYEWVLSADGGAFATLGQPARLVGAEPGPAAIVWDLRERPAARWQTGTHQGGAALSPDGRTVAYEADRTHVVLATRDGERKLPGLGRPFAFSSSGDHVLGFGADKSLRQVAVPLAGGPPVDLGRWILATTAGDRALMYDETVLFGDYRELTVSLRDINTGQPAWTETEHGNDSLQAYHGPSRTHDLELDPRGEWLAERSGDRWQLGTLATGTRPRDLDIGLHTDGAMLAGGRFAVAHGTDLWLWDPDLRPATPHLEIHAVSPVAARVVGYTKTQPTPRLWDMSSGTSSALPCLTDVAPDVLTAFTSAFALDAQGRVLFADAAGRACIGDTADARPLTFPEKVASVALAGAGPGFGATFLDGTVLAYKDRDAAPARWQLAGKAFGLAATATGDGFIAHNDAGEVFALQIGDATPTPIARLDMPGRGDFRRPAIATLPHPSAPITATILSESDTLVLHDFAADRTDRHTLRLAELPTGAWSPGGRLAVALGGARLALLDPGAAPRELTLGEDAGGLAFIDEQQLVVQGMGSSLMRVDLVTGDHTVIGHTWDPAHHIDGTRSPSQIVALPTGETLVWREHVLTRHAADTVPPVGPDLAPWLARRARALGTP